MFYRIALLITALASFTAEAQTLTTLASFDGANGSVPYTGALVQGRDGNLYGTTYRGGANGQGVVFFMTRSGQLNAIYSFNETDGANPMGGLTILPDGTFYGTTSVGGANNDGTVYSVTPSGDLTTLVNFDSKNGSSPEGPPIMGFNGKLYGTTGGGGKPQKGASGTVYEMSKGGELTTLQNFNNLRGSAGDTGGGLSGALVQAADGSLYGSAAYFGPHDNGDIFVMRSTGSFQVLHGFTADDGSQPAAPLLLASDGNLYGSTDNFGPYGFGTIFKITQDGHLTTLHAFNFNGTDGFLANPLTEGTDGNLYGTAALGGANDYGTLFQITPTGSFTILHDFANTGDGQSPTTPLVQATDGDFYGMTQSGENGNGGVYRLSMGLAPFVKLLPAFGSAGSKVMILGTDLTGATSVTFNGVSANFTVRSPTDISAEVPAGIGTGVVQVGTPSRTLTSNVAFLVR